MRSSRVSGFACYDPRDGTQTLGTPSTYKYSANAAIINANYLIHELGAAFPTDRVGLEQRHHRREHLRSGRDPEERRIGAALLLCSGLVHE
jgi:hypothetical protein